MTEPSQEQLLALWKTCSSFIDNNDIHCGETVYQCDRVILGAYDFIADICEIVGYKDIADEDTEDEE